jgi:peptidoglycan hydrolase-like protein with peptidoglycan-binding domain
MKVLTIYIRLSTMRYITRLTVLALLVSLPVISQAQTIEQVTASLLSQISQLQVQLGGSSSQTTVTNPVSGARCVAITRTLARTDSGSEVLALQRFLVSEGLLDASNTTGTFGPVTEAAVKAWQTSKGIEATGTVGPRTRAALGDCGGTAVPIIPGSQCPVVQKPVNCTSAVEVRTNGCTVGWQCSHTALPAQTFNASPTAGPSPHTVRFTGVVTSASAGFCPGSFCAATIVFGDGKSGAIPLPNAQGASVTYDVSHTYTTAGNFTALLYQGSASESTPRIGSPIAISVTGTQPIVTPVPPAVQTPTLIANPQNGSAPVTITFVVTNISTPTGYTIDFGDGSTGTLIVIGNTIGATHTYATPGTYSARLRLPNSSGTACSGGACTVVSVAQITVGTGIPQDTSLVASPDSGVAPLGVIFGINGGNNTFPGGVILDFADGTTEVVCTPGQICGPRTITHNFTQPGTYEVQLVGLGSGQNSVLKKRTVTVLGIVPTALTASPQSGNAPLEVSFRGHGGNRSYVGGVMLHYGDDLQEEFCAANTVCGEKTKTHTYATGNPYTARLIAFGTTTAASTTIAAANVSVVGGPTRIVVKNPTGQVRKGDSTRIEWTVSGTKPTNASLSFDLYTRAGNRIGTILTITNIQTGNATWKVPSVADVGCTASQPNGLCGVNIIPGEYTIQPVIVGANVESLTATSFEIRDGTVLPGGFVVTPSPSSAEINREMQINYRVANPPFNSAVALWLVRQSGEEIGLIDAKLEADQEMTTYRWDTGIVKPCPQAFFESGTVCNQSDPQIVPGLYHILGKVYSPFNGNPISPTANTLTHAVATSTPITIKAQNSGSCVVLTNDLGPGDRDSDTNGEVSKLQTFLAEDSAIYPEGAITGFYGNATRRAVERFQAANGIRSSGSPDTNGYGAVGPSTRAAIAAKCGQSSVKFTASPAAGKAPLVVTFTIVASEAGSYNIQYGDGSRGAIGNEGCGSSTPNVPCTWSATSTITHTYESNGTYIASVTDRAGKVVGQTTVRVTNDTVIQPSQCAQISRTLAPDDTDALTGGDVSRLQQYLAANPVLYPQGLITGYYGPATVAAVKRYQAQQGISQTGAIGPLTLERIRCTRPAPTDILTPSPASGAAPLVVRFSTNQNVQSGSYRIVFGDGSEEWMTAATVAHTYTTGGRYTAQLIKSIGNCFGLTGNELRICEIGASSVLGTAVVEVGQSANALSVSVFPATVSTGGNITVTWSTTNAPVGSKVRLEVYPDSETPSTGNNDRGIASNTSQLQVNGNYSWTVPFTYGPRLADAGHLTTLPLGTYRIHAKLYSGSSCWGFCPSSDRQIHATAQSGLFTITATSSAITPTPTTPTPTTPDPTTPLPGAGSGTIVGDSTNILTGTAPRSLSRVHVVIYPAFGPTGPDSVIYQSRNVDTTNGAWRIALPITTGYYSAKLFDPVSGVELASVPFIYIAAAGTVPCYLNGTCSGGGGGNN